MRTSDLTRTTSLPSFVLLVLTLFAPFSAPFSAPLSAAEFKGGNMFVSSSGDHRIYEVDKDGALVRTIGVGSGLAAPRGLAFGPDGNLYVASYTGNQVMVFDGDGAVVRTIGAGLGMSGVSNLAFGPGGRLLVCSGLTQNLFVFDFQGVKLSELQSTQLSVTCAVAVGPDGNIYLAGGKVLTEFDAGGIELGYQLLNIFGSDDYTGLAYGGKGLLSASVDDPGDDEIRFYGDQLVNKGQAGTAFGALSGPRGLAFGPNGNLFVVDASIVKEIEPISGGVKLQDHAVGIGLSNPYAVAFAPYAYSATVSGKITRDGVGTKKLKEKKARLQVFPGTGEMSLWFVDDPTSSNDIASVFSADPILFRGFEATAAADASTRVVIGTEVPGESKASGMASLALTLTGKKSSKGGVTAGLLGVKGTLHRASPDGVIAATISAKKPLK